MKEAVAKLTERCHGSQEMSCLEEEAVVPSQLRKLGTGEGACDRDRVAEVVVEAPVGDHR